MREQRISVRNLIEFLLRSGDIDNRIGEGADPAAMQEGSRIHRKIQKSMPSDYKVEVPLAMVFEQDGIRLLIEGRADGIQRSGGKVLVDEIKGIYADPAKLTEPRLLHLAQARCYAGILAMQEELSEVSCQITYCSLETEEIRRFCFEYSGREAAEYLNMLAGEYFRWARLSAEHEDARDESASSLEFPYPYRKGQKETAVNVYRAIRRSRDLYIQAPTGVGKTLSVLYPAVRAVGEGLSDRIFYMTAKTAARSVAEDTFRLFLDRGLDFRTASVTAKEKICLNQDGCDCNPESCPYAKGHFDRINEALYALVSERSMYTRNEITEYAERYKVCPYELSLDAAVFSDAVIGDYNYAFDPRVHLRRFFGDTAGGGWLLLADEAHNLPSRASEMFSADLSLDELKELSELVKEHGKRLKNAVSGLKRHFNVIRRSMDSFEPVGREEMTGRKTVLLPGADMLYQPALRCFSELSRYLEENRKAADRKEILTYFFRVRTFVTTLEVMGDDFRVYAALDEEGKFMIRLFCADPSESLKRGLSHCRSSIFFSATFLPVTYYKERITGNPEDYAVYTESPFDRKNRLILYSDEVSSRYTRRNGNEYRRIAEYIEILAHGRAGSYLCFFPSYRYLSEIASVLELPEEAVFIQKPSMTEEEREIFLSEIGRADGVLRVGLCVTGGVFSEGIDLKGEKLLGAVIVGTGLSAINAEAEILKSYYSENGRNGFDYAYRYPGMNKVLQAAGRVIRSEEDRGIILLLDDRYAMGAERSLFPREWDDVAKTDRRQLPGQLKEFWNISTHVK